MDLIAYSDGHHNLFQIAVKIGVDLRTLVNEVRLLREAGLLETLHAPPQSGKL